MYVYLMYAGTCKGQKWESDSLELELLTVGGGRLSEKTKSAFGGGGRTIPDYWVLRGQHAQLHLRSCSLIAFQVESTEPDLWSPQPRAPHHTSSGAHAHSKRSANFQINNGTLSMNLSRRH